MVRHKRLRKGEDDQSIWNEIKQKIRLQRWCCIIPVLHCEGLHQQFHVGLITYRISESVEASSDSDEARPAKRARLNPPASDSDQTEGELSVFS